MQSIHSPTGWLKIEEEGGHVVNINFLSRKPMARSTPSALEKKAEVELGQYFRGQVKKFNLPLRPAGTEFQQRVWRALQRIPYGQVKTYGQLAKELKSSAQAVGNACRANPIPIIIPCHRVIAASGIGGYAGQTDGPVLARKRWLLALEGIVL